MQEFTWETYSEEKFEKVMAYWNAQIEDDYKEIEKTYKILKEKLKRF